MKKKIQELYENINFIGFYSTYNRDIQYIDKIRKLWPQITEFIKWFLNDKLQEFDSNIKTGLQVNLIGILKDCEEAFKYNDTVLMRDALEEGLVEYLKMFLSEKELQEIGEKNVRTE